jgi:predicted permease
MGVDPGFSIDRLLTFQINAPQPPNAQTPNPQALLDYYDRLFAALDAIPGVAASGGTTRVPLGSTNVSTLVSIDGREIPPAQLPEVEFRRAQNGYFDAMGIPVLRGRGFTRGDAGLTAQPVCVINHAMQLRLFPGEDPIGRRIRTGTNPQAPWITIVGVVGDVRHGSLEEAPKSELYISGNQNPPNSPYIAIRASGDPGALADAVRRAVWSVDSHTPIYDMKTMTSMRSESVAERRFVLTLASVFGVLALLLAASGVYGVMALIVSERTPEVGVRVALGATRTNILTLIVGHSAKLGLIGIAIGVAASVVLAPLMASQLFGVRPFDLVTFAIVPLVLMSAAILAAAMPARRAMQVDPVVALRND